MVSIYCFTYVIVSLSSLSVAITWLLFTEQDHKLHEPTSLFEHFFIVGLHSYANVEVIEHAFAKRKTWESEVAKSEILDLHKLHYHGHPPPMEPEVVGLIGTFY